MYVEVRGVIDYNLIPIGNILLESAGLDDDLI